MDLSPVFLIVVIILVMPLFVYLAVKQHKISKEVYALLAEDFYPEAALLVKTHSNIHKN